MKNLIYRTYIYVHDIYTHTYAYAYAYVRVYIYNTYTFCLYILCKNCIKIHLNYLKYHFNFNTLTICVSLYYNT